MNRMCATFKWAALGLLLFSTTATGGIVRADATSGLIVGVPSGVGTMDLRAHSEQTAPIAIGPNNVTSDSAAPGVGAAPLFGGAILVGSFFPTPYSPLVGVLRAPKTTRTITSASGNTSSFAQFQTAVGGAPAEIRAFARVDPGVTGTAAAEAFDPYVINPGLYDYSFFISELSLGTTATSLTGANFFAIDSRFDEFLWRLDVEATGLIGDNLDLLILFDSNPILNLDDDLITAQLRNAFSIFNGIASLASFQVFETPYPVTQSILFGEGAVAGTAESIPEPSSITLLTAALLGLCGYVWQRRRRAKPEAALSTQL